MVVAFSKRQPGRRRNRPGAIEKAKLDSFAKGEAIGLEKGEAIGLEKGEAIGFEKGDIMRGKKVVLWMLSKKTFSIEVIAEATGFSVNEIKYLQESISLIET
jgi:predicted transposase/invertase (TIGR01784 family)